MKKRFHTWIRILQLLLEPGKRRAKGIRELEEDLVEGEDGLLPDVGPGVVEEPNNIRREITGEVGSQEVGEAVQGEGGVEHVGAREILDCVLV